MKLFARVSITNLEGKEASEAYYWGFHHFASVRACVDTDLSLIVLHMTLKTVKTRKFWTQGLRKKKKG